VTDGRGGSTRNTTPGTQDLPSKREAWLDQAEKLSRIVALGGVLVYGVLLLAYEQFYRELGVGLSDVGVEYGKALGGAAGLTIVLLVLTAVLVGILHLIVAAVFLFTGRRDGRNLSFVLAFVATFGLLVLIAALLLPHWATARADAVKKGHPIQPLRLPPWGHSLRVVILAIRADPAEVQLTQGERASTLRTTVEGLKKPLFYLGEAKGQTVLYEADTQRAIFIPSSLVVLQTSNCETHRSPDRICRQVKK
jgi:hypothetical protein